MEILAIRPARKTKKALDLEKYLTSKQTKKETRYYSRADTSGSGDDSDRLPAPNPRGCG
jgi:hypothetical protein